jgi:Cu(I)/Ag(I) efflux system membrane fusion protein
MAAEEKDTSTPEHDDDPVPEGEEPPPRGVKVMAAVRWVIVVVAALLAAFMWLSYARTQLSAAKPGETAAAPKYHCPMHPQIVSDEPGECPICHMSLEPIAGGRSAPVGVVPAGGASPKSAQDASSGGEATAGFSCPMHPSVQSATPGRCPICKMPLEPVDGGAPDASATALGSLPPGTTPVKLALDRIQSTGVRTAIAEARTFVEKLRVTAVVMPPEQGVSEIHVRTPGFVEAVNVDQTGMTVRAGQPMLEVYSPEILQAQNELLATSQFDGDAGASSTSSARRKLELLGMAKAEIERMIAKREAIRAITVAAPRGGFVTKKNVVLGSYVTPEMALFEVQDLSTVYVVADVFLSDIGLITVGAEGRFTPSGHPDRAAMAKVDLVYPIANAETRTRRIRMRIRNDANKAYAPGEYGTVELAVAPRSGVSIPRDALIDTGTASYVFVVESEGRFVPRVVAASGSDADHVRVAFGLAAGERVVSGATFLIDSESRLQASIAQAVPSSPPTSHAPGGGNDPSCEADFDRQKMPDKWAECMKCETVHRGMGSMAADCKRAIARPWK